MMIRCSVLLLALDASDLANVGFSPTDFRFWFIPAAAASQDMRVSVATTSKPKANSALALCYNDYDRHVSQTSSKTRT